MPAGPSEAGKSPKRLPARTFPTPIIRAGSVSPPLTARSPRARRRDPAVPRPGGRRAAARPADAAGRPPLLALVGVLEAFPRDWLVHLPDLQAHAARRGVRRLVGTRDAAGGLVEPALIAEVLDPGDWVRPAGFELARHAATLVLRVSRRVRLADRLTGAPVPVVAGILLDRLRAYHGYALVADGGPAVPLTVRVGRRRLFEELWKAGVLETEDGTPATDYDPDAAYRLRLDQLPAAPPAVAAAGLAGTFDELARLRVLTSLVAARLKGESAEYSPEQVEELRRHYLTPGLHLSFPTTTPYTDLKKALAEGTVGTRTGYRIDVGTRDVLSLSKFRPASEFLDRVYEALPGPTPEERVYRHRRLSPRTRLTKADEFMKRLSDDFLGVAPNGSAVATLEAVGAADLATIVRDRAADKQTGPPDADRGTFRRPAKAGDPAGGGLPGEARPAGLPRRRDGSPAGRDRRETADGRANHGEVPGTGAVEGRAGRDVLRDRRRHPDGVRNDRALLAVSGTNHRVTEGTEGRDTERNTGLKSEGRPAPVFCLEPCLLPSLCFFPLWFVPLKSPPAPPRRRRGWRVPGTSPGRSTRGGTAPSRRTAGSCTRRRAGCGSRSRSPGRSG